MKFTPVFIFTILVCISPAAAQNFNSALRDELLAMEKLDQQLREECAKGSADEQFKCLGEKTLPVDKKHEKRLAEIVAAGGFPAARTVGKEGVRAFMTVLQHAPSDDLRVKLLKPIKNAFERKEISPSEYSGFVDRLLVHQSKPQIYGSNFESKDGKIVMSKTKDVKNLDRRRAKIGLPPIAEYVKMLKEFYKLEVEL